MEKNISLVLKDSQGKNLGYKIINTSINRLHEIKGDIKIRNEVIKEILHNAIEENADEISVIISYIDKNKVKIKMEYIGNELNSFKSKDEILKALFDADESSKNNRRKDVGGKGRGAKILLSSGNLKVSSINENRFYEIEIDNLNNQVEAIKYGDSSEFQVTILKDGEVCSEYSINKVIYIIDEVDTDDIRYFEHDSLVKYLQYFTVLGGITDKFIDKVDLKVKVKGLVEAKEGYITIENSEILKIKDKFEELKNRADERNYSFNYIKCFDSIIESNIKVGTILNIIDYDSLKRFFTNGRKCFILRTKDKSFKNELLMLRNSNQSDFFGIYIGTQFVMINEKITGLSKKQAGKNSGGNLFAQYFGYVYNEELDPTGNRNSISADKSYYKFKEELNEVMPIINKVLAANELEKTKSKTVVLKDIDTKLIEGLWAELKYIDQDITRFEGWRSPKIKSRERCPHDFEFNDKYVEIKAKLDEDNAYRNIIEISSVEQLDDSREGELRIYYLNKYASNSSDGKNIIDLIEDVEKRLVLEEDKESLLLGIENYLETKNISTLYNDIINNKDNYDFSALDRFEVSKCIFYEINSDFPACKSRMLDAKKNLCILLDKGYSIDIAELKLNGFWPKEIEV